MTLKDVRKTHAVPAKRGAIVRFTPDTRDKPMVGRIVGTSPAGLLVRFEGFEKPWNCHPLYSMEYKGANGRYQQAQTNRGL